MASQFVRLLKHSQIQNLNKFNFGKIIGNQSRFFGSLVQVTLPDLGEGTKEATVKEWYVKPGSRVQEFDDLVEVFTDKLVAKIPSTCTGTVKDVLFKVDDICLVGHSLLSIELENEESSNSKVTDSVDVNQPIKSDYAAKNQKAFDSGPDTQSQKALSTPAVRHLAKQNHIDISVVPATGKNGRVTKEDVLKYIDMKNNKQVKKEEKTIQQDNINPQAVGISSGDQVKKIVGMKKAMTKTMTQALTIPTFTFSDDMNATSLLHIRQESKAHIDGLTILPFFIKALSLAMLKYPIVNSIVNPEMDSEGLIKEYVIKKDHNFSIAIDSKEGLTTPNIKNVNLKTIKQINQDLKDLQYRSENNKLVKSDFEDSTFSVSSVGNIGGRYFVPTILSPQTAIIAIGKAQKVPRYIHHKESDLKHQWEPIDQISFSITADHRILDGATVARFAQTMKMYIEHPNIMLLSQ